MQQKKCCWKISFASVLTFLVHQAYLHDFIEGDRNVAAGGKDPMKTDSSQIELINEESDKDKDPYCIEGSDASSNLFNQDVPISRDYELFTKKDAKQDTTGLP